MFTGIIESLGEVKKIASQGSNLIITIGSEFADQLQVDQSVAHDGICLTVAALLKDQSAYQVIAVEETLSRTTLKERKKGDYINLERSMPANGRFDGHMVLGHVDQIAMCTGIDSKKGSWIYTFKYQNESGHITVEKGSICVNGVSLTCFDNTQEGFSVAVIPYTYKHTNFKYLESGDSVNLEFDIIGKYVKKYLSGG